MTHGLALPPALAARIAGGGEHFWVTGASGWVGRVTLHLLAGALGKEGFLRRVTCFASAARQVDLDVGFTVETHPLRAMPTSADAPVILLHLAYPTKDKVADLGVDAFVRTGAAITARVLGVVERAGVKGVFFPSSGAVYGAGGGLETDLDSNPYGAMKHIDELALRQCSREVGARCVITRVFSLSGPYMNKRERYVLAHLVDRALNGLPLDLSARRPVRRSYLAARDLAHLALALLLDEGGPPECVFDSGGPVVEVGELAEHVRRTLGVGHLPIVRDWDPDAPADDYAGDPEAVSRLAERYDVHLADLTTQILQTAGR